jgi:hypothetical protein
MKGYERKASASNKKAKMIQKMGNKTSNIGNKRPATDNLRDFSSSEEEDGIVRPHKDKIMPMSKLDFLEKMKMLNHPILLDEDQLEMTFQYIDLANSMLRKSSKKIEEMTDMEEDQDTGDKKASRREGPPFFRGDMSTTIMVKRRRPNCSRQEGQGLEPGFD